MGKVSVRLGVSLIDRKIGRADFGVLVFFGILIEFQEMVNSSIFEFRFYKKVFLISKIALKS